MLGGSERRRAMHRIELTRGDERKVIKDFMTDREFGNESELVTYAIDAMFAERHRDDAPTGYRITDGEGRLLRDRPYA
jgi:hypothetical protein